MLTNTFQLPVNLSIGPDFLFSSWVNSIFNYISHYLRTPLFNSLFYDLCQFFHTFDIYADKYERVVEKFYETGNLLYVADLSRSSRNFFLEDKKNNQVDGGVPY